MAKKTKKASWLYIALGAVVGVGAVMGVSRLLTNDRSNLGTTLNDIETDVNLEGYEIMLAYDDADKILEICRSAMEASDYRSVEIGYTYAAVATYTFCDDKQCRLEGVTIEMFYDYSENSEDDVLAVNINGTTVFKVDQSGILSKDYVCPDDSNDEMKLIQSNITSYKLEYGEREYLNEDVSEDMSTPDLLPDEIINLVRLVAPAE